MSGPQQVAPADARHVVRSFWHGMPIGPYQLLCLASFTTRGHAAEVFTYDDDMGVPDWVTQRNARDILPTEHVQLYRTGFGVGSPSLHSNLFRYVLLQRLGGWWVDLDILLLDGAMPDEPFFFSQAATEYLTLNSSVLKFPAGHPLLDDAVAACQATAEAEAVWGETGPQLVTRLVDAHGLRPLVRPSHSTYPVRWQDVGALFDPAQGEAIEAQCQGAIFLHLFNEIWRGSGIPSDQGPPTGSYLDLCFRRYDFGHRFPCTMRTADVMRWINNRRGMIEASEALRGLQSRYEELLRQYTQLRAEHR